MRFVMSLLLLGSWFSFVTGCGSEPDAAGVAAERVTVDQAIDVKLGGSPLLTFHVLTLETHQGPRLGISAHNTGSRTINSATYVLRLRDNQGGRGIVFEYVGMLGALATGARSPRVLLDTGVVLTQMAPAALDQGDLVQLIRLDATGFVTSNPFSGLYHGSVASPPAAGMPMSGTVTFDGVASFAIEGGLGVGGGASLLRGTLEPTGRFAGSAIRSDGLAVAVVANPGAAAPLQASSEGKLTGVLNVTSADQAPFDITLNLDRRTQ
jgi:hypothetical protein